jgi:hypothetical protein
MAIRSRLISVGRFFGAAVVAVLVFACTADAVQTTTTPNVSVIPYNLAAGAFSSNMTPPANVPVFLTGTCTTFGERGVGYVSLLRIPGSDPSGGFIEWSGKNSATNTANSGKNSADYSPPAGVRIIAIDYGDKVLLERGSTNDTVRVHNTTTGPRAGSTTWIW